MKHAGDNSHKNHAAQMKRTFFVCFIITIPIFLLSDLFTVISGFSLAFYGSTLVQVLCTTFVFLYGGYIFFRGAVNELKRLKPGMMTLVALAIVVAYGYSLAVFFGLQGPLFFLELVTLIDIMLLGHWIEMRAIDATSRAVRELARLLPAQAHRVEEDGIVDVSLDQLRVGDIVLVRAGERIPSDGMIIEGSSDINEAMLTGEAKPVNKSNGDEVIAGSINGTGTLRIEVKKEEKDSYVNRISQFVSQVLKSKSQAQDSADQAALILTFIAIFVGSAALAIWLIVGASLAFSLERMVSVMVVTCPHALGLAIPLVIVSITSLAAQRGFIIRNRRVFEDLGDIDTIMFDKTGTLTQGSFTVTDMYVIEEIQHDDFIKKIATLEQSAEHAIARAIVAYAQQQDLLLSRAIDVQTIPGKGIQGSVDGELIRIGNVKLVESQDLQAQAQSWMQQGKTVVFVAYGAKPVGLVAISDTIRSEASVACAKLKKLGKKLVMITGDNPMSAAYVAKKIGIDTFFAEVLPEEKVAKVREVQKQGAKVTMVGDGINDAPALAAADCGIAIGSGSDVSAETADVILVSNDLRNIIDVFELSRLTRRKIIQNLLWATGYNVVAIPLAAGLLYGYGIVLSPGIGAAIMSLSTIVVAFNSRLIKL